MILFFFYEDSTLIYCEVISNECDCGCQVCVVRIKSDSVLVSIAESQRQESSKGAAQEVVRQLVFLCHKQHHREGRRSCKPPLQTVV